METFVRIVDGGSLTAAAFIWILPFPKERRAKPHRTILP
jgi:hypothetical protein